MHSLEKGGTGVLDVDIWWLSDNKCSRTSFENSQVLNLLALLPRT